MSKNHEVDVLLVNPGYLRGHKQATHQSYPLGLAYLAANLEKNGLRTEIIDCGLDDIRKSGELRPTIVGVSVLTPVLREAYDTIRYLQKFLPDAEIIVGGVHITADPGIIEPLSVRHGLRGDSEDTIVDLCQRIRDGRTPRDEGLVSNDTGVVKHGSIHYVKDLDSLPYPIFTSKSIKRYRFHPIVTSRGCPYSCVYCSLACTPLRFRSVDNVIGEMDYLVKEFGIKRLDFVDDTFTIDQDRIVQLLDALQQKRINLTMACTTRVDLVDERLLTDMKKAGIGYISFGVESGVERVRAALGKDIPNRQYETVFELCKKLGIRTRAYVMFGNPTETVDDMERTVHFIKKIKPDDTVFRITDVVPNSKLFTIMKRRGLIEDSAWKEYMLGRLSYPVFIPESLNSVDITNFYESVEVDFYLSREYIMRKIRSLLGV
ncbi:MAG: radical SAM protein [Candidatus Altiarchaeota archaeon]